MTFRGDHDMDAVCAKDLDRGGVEQADSAWVSIPMKSGPSMPFCFR